MAAFVESLAKPSSSTASRQAMARRRGWHCSPQPCPVTSGSQTPGRWPPPCSPIHRALASDALRDAPTIALVARAAEALYWQGRPGRRGWRSCSQRPRDHRHRCGPPGSQSLHHVGGPPVTAGDQRPALPFRRTHNAAKTLKAPSCSWSSSPSGAGTQLADYRQTDLDAGARAGRQPVQGGSALRCLGPSANAGFPTWTTPSPRRPEPERRLRGRRLDARRRRHHDGGSTPTTGVAALSCSTRRSDPNSGVRALPVTRGGTSQAASRKSSSSMVGAGSSATTSSSSLVSSATTW